MVEIIKTIFMQIRRLEAGFDLNNDLNVPLNFEEKFHTEIRLFMEDTPVLALKIIKRGQGVILEIHVMVMH